MIRKITCDNLDKAIRSNEYYSEAAIYLKAHERVHYMEIIKFYVGEGIELTECAKCANSLNPEKSCDTCDNKSTERLAEREMDCIWDAPEDVEEILEIVADEAGREICRAARQHWLKWLGVAKYYRLISNVDLYDEFRMLWMLYELPNDEFDMDWLSDDWEMIHSDRNG